MRYTYSLKQIRPLCSHCLFCNSAAKVTKKYLQTKYLYFFYCDTFFLQYILHKRTTLFCGILNIYYFCTTFFGECGIFFNFAA